MPVTTIDPMPALVVIDLQKGILARPTAHPIEDVVRRSSDLVAAFRAHHLPVVRVNVTGGAPGRTDAKSRLAGVTPAPDWADLVTDLGTGPDDVLITKRTWGAFHGTGLDQRLRALGVTQIVLTGVSTSAGVESTARAAHEHGYHVVLAADAMTDPDADAHRHSVERTFPRLGEVTTTPEILRLLEENR